MNAIALRQFVLEKSRTTNSHGPDHCPQCGSPVERRGNGIWACLVCAQPTPIAAPPVAPIRPDLILERRTHDYPMGVL